jgi:hypothetical protein
VSSKRNAQAANLEDVKERVDKLRKATTAGISLSEVTDDVGDGSDADEIEIDDELYDDNAGDDGGAQKSTGGLEVKNIGTKAVPTAVLGSRFRSKSRMRIDLSSPLAHFGAFGGTTTLDRTISKE